MDEFRGGGENNWKNKIYKSKEKSKKRRRKLAKFKELPENRETQPPIYATWFASDDRSLHAEFPIEAHINLHTFIDRRRKKKQQNVSFERLRDRWKSYSFNSSNKSDWNAVNLKKKVFLEKEREEAKKRRKMVI